jgi:hypothetical protein
MCSNMIPDGASPRFVPFGVALCSFYRTRRCLLARRMILFPESITLVVGQRARAEKMVELAASMSLRGEVHVLDAGNSFSAYGAARYVRRQTPRSQDVLRRILVARAFTCYQVVSLLRQTPDSQDPKLVMDLLSTFSDENVSPEESRRVLGVVIGELRRLRRTAAVAISISRPPQPERAGLVDLLVEVADRVQRENDMVRFKPARLL